MRPAAWLRFLCVILSLCFAGFMFSGCGGKAPAPAKEVFYRTEDSAGRHVELPKKPERVVLLASFFVGIMNAVGGEFIAWADSPASPPPAGAEGKKTVGYTHQVNVEETVSLKPDLVVGLHGLHDRLAPVMEGNQIPFLLLSLSRYEDVERALLILGGASGHSEEGKKAVERLREAMKETLAAMPEEGKTCAILHGTPHSVTFEGCGTIATETAELLHIKNVFAQKEESAKLPPFSLESLAATDPDILFLMTMVMPGQEEAAFRKNLLDQPAYSGIRAVREGRVYFLPQNLFLSSPGVDYPLALKCMAEKIYGDKVS